MSKVYGLIFTNADPRVTPSISLAPTLVTFFQIGGTTLAAPGITKPIPTVGLYTFEYNPGLTLPVYFLADGGAAVTDSTLRYLSGFLDPIQQVDQQAQTLTALGNTNIALGTTNVALGTTNFALGTTSVALGNSNIALNSSQIAQGNTLLAGETLIFNQNLSLYALSGIINNQATSLTANGASVYAAALTILAQTATIAVNVSGIIVNVSLNAAAIDEINLKLGTTMSVIGTNLVNPPDVFGYLKRLQEFNEGNQTFNKNTGIWDISSRGNTLLAEKTLTNTSSQVTKS